MRGANIQLADLSGKYGSKRRTFLYGHKARIIRKVYKFGSNKENGWGAFAHTFSGKGCPRVFSLFEPPISLKVFLISRSALSKKEETKHTNCTYTWLRYVVTLVKRLAF